jgi:predicted nucleic acid-binding protein
VIQKVFLDTNVIMDLILEREPFSKEAKTIFTVKDEYGFDIFISALSIANIAYSLDRSGKKPHDTISKLLYWVSIIDLSVNTIKETALSKFDDFEDGLQYFCAFSIDADVIITRNKKDFKHAIIPVFTPHEFLTQLAR